MSQILVDVVLYRIRQAVNEGNIPLAAFWVIENALCDAPGNQEVVREALAIQRENPLLLCEINNLLLGDARNAELGEVTDEMAQKVGGALVQAGW